MKALLIRRPSSAMVVAVIALFVALGGTGYAATSFNRSPRGTVAKKQPRKPSPNDNAQDTKLFKQLFAKANLGPKMGSYLAGHVVPNASHADTADTATNAGHASVADDATDATNAANAANAANATNAANLDGQSFAQINASAASDQPATLLSGFGGLTLQCIAGSGTSGTVTLRVVNDSPQTGTLGAGEVGSSSFPGQFESGSVTPAVGGTPTDTNFTYDVNGGAQVSFAFEIPAGGTTSVVTGAFTMLQDNGCAAFGNAHAS